MKTLVLFSALLSAALAINPYHRPAPYHPAPYHPAPYDYHPASSYHASAPANYRYGYAVSDDYAGVDFDANEESDGHGGTHGGYSVLLPDGRRQIVTYTVDDYSGFVADVKYEGYARPEPYHPKPYHPAPYHPRPYHPAAPYHPLPYHA